MKFIVAFVAIVAVASAGYVKPVVSANEELAAIIAAINHPSTDPATAVLLEQQLFQILGLLPEPQPIAVGPEIIDFPLPDGGAVTAEDPITIVDVMPVLDGQNPAPVPAPVVSTPASSPLVQIILNVNAAANPGAVAITPLPALVEEPTPVVVDEILRPTPVAVGEIPRPTPVVVDEILRPTPVVIEQIPRPTPVVVRPPEPVIVVDTPEHPAVVIPAPVVIPEPIEAVPLPATLN